ncbi:hypothetical protein [uncultured Sunxiuqinia sp.]|uniref:hypothetical protein n=1 Tax=uncultured Sunxiuqinia sp. TaxID=1573825 RepID=UPI002AA92CA8|nr:hypothetical protein [uncultured Sunxiuqinia sp.]
MKKLKKFLTTVLILFIAVVSFFLIGNYLLSGYIQNKLQKNPISSFLIKEVDVSVDVFRREITLNKIEAADSMGNGKITVTELSVSGIRLWPWLVRNEIVAGRMFVLDPMVQLNMPNDSDQVAGSRSEISKQDFALDELEIVGSQIFFLKRNEERLDTVFVGILDFNFHNISSKSSDGQFVFKQNSFEAVHLKLKNGRYNLPNQLYAVECQSLDFNSDKQRLTIDELHFLSRYSKYEIGKQLGVETDWLDLVVAGFTVNELQFSKLLTDSALIFNEAQINELYLNAFKDKRLPFPKKPDTKLPMRMIQDLPFQMHGDSISIEKGSIRYAERVKNSKDEGAVTFDSLCAKIYCLSTIDRLIDRQTTMHAEARVMNQGWLKAEFIFPNEKYSHVNRVSGAVSAMSIKAFNPVITQNASVFIEDGHLKELAFNFTYNNNQSNGDLIFEYDDLKVRMLDAEDEFNKKIQSFITNSFLLHKRNLREENSFREGTISFDRDKKKSIFNYWWKSVLSGIKSISIL